MRVCLAYDCLYPYTIGGAERWYRGLADELVAAGHEVTYLTRRQWPEGEAPAVPGVRVVSVARAEPLYDEQGRRRIGQAVRFGVGVLRHLARNRRRYDALHTASFPFFSLVAARAAMAGTGVPLGVDWFEVWSRGYWEEYLGPVKGAVGLGVQRLCVRLTDTAFVFSDLHGARLVQEGLRARPVRLSGLYAGSFEVTGDAEAPRRPLAVFAGRHIPEKRPELVPAAVVAARRSVPGLEGLVLGDGPRRGAVLAAIAAARAEDCVSAPGFVDREELTGALERATCHVLPSSREGYGLVVIEAAAHGTPSVVVAAEDNAATELIEEGVNGFVAASPDALAEAIVRVHEAGPALRASTAAWFAAQAPRLTVQRSADTILRTLGR